MTGLNKLIAITIIVHVAVFGATILLQNAVSETPYYGGNTGFLPSTGDSNHAYDQFSGWLSGGAQEEEVDDPESGSIIDTLKWIVLGPLCSTVSIVKFLISFTIIKYGFIDDIPNMGFGLWFKTVIHVVATLLHVTLISILVRFAVQAGVFSNPQLLGLLIGVSLLGAVVTALNAGGAFSCG